MTLAVDEKGAGTGKLKTLSGKRELSSLCSADFGLYEVTAHDWHTDGLASAGPGSCSPQGGIGASAGLC